MGGAEGAHEAGCQLRQGAPQLRRQQGQAVGRLFPLQGPELSCEQVQPLFPGNLREFSRTAGPAPLERLRHPVGMVELLQNGLSPGAEFSPVDRVSGVPLDLFGPPFGHPDQDAAAGRTEAAGAGIIVGPAGSHPLVGRDQVGDQFLVLPTGTPKARRRRPSLPLSCKKVLRFIRAPHL